MLKSNVSRVLNIFKAAPDTLNATSKWVFQVAEAGYQSQIKALTAKDSGFHFFTQNISEEQLRDFSMEDTSKRMQNHAPDLWNLLGALLAADESLNRKRELWAQKSDGQTSNASHAHSRRVDDGDIEMHDFSVADVDTDDIRLVDDEDDHPEDIYDHVEHQKMTLITIVG